MSSECVQPLVHPPTSTDRQQLEKQVEEDCGVTAPSSGQAENCDVTAPPPGQAGDWRLQHVSGDLFSCPAEDSLAHCISEDVRMGAGIAVLFKKKFDGVEELKNQKKTPGQCAVLTRGKRFVYYLITKKKASQKPTIGSLKQSLEDMKSHCSKHGVTSISMPRIGCGLDRLQWKDVSEVLAQVFQNTGIRITVYSLPETGLPGKPPHTKRTKPHTP